VTKALRDATEAPRDVPNQKRRTTLSREVATSCCDDAPFH
jgi:hypothetical protein